MHQQHFDNIGFKAIKDDILKNLVVYRICHPQSRVATVGYLKSYFDEDVELHKIYYYFDKLSDIRYSKSALSTHGKCLVARLGLCFMTLQCSILRQILPIIFTKWDSQKTANIRCLKWFWAFDKRWRLTDKHRTIAPLFETGFWEKIALRCRIVKVRKWILLMLSGLIIKMIHRNFS